MSIARIALLSVLVKFLQQMRNIEFSADPIPATVRSSNRRDDVVDLTEENRRYRCRAIQDRAGYLRFKIG